MKDHYQINDLAWTELQKHGIVQKDLLKFIKLFDPNYSESEITKVNLMYYVDSKGDFSEPPFFPHKRIAKAVFDSLDTREKLDIMEYIDYLENGDDDEED